MCICNMDNRINVYEKMSQQSSIIGHLTPNGCKAQEDTDPTENWKAILINHQIGFVDSTSVHVETCAGDPLEEDILTTGSSLPNIATPYSPVPSDSSTTVQVSNVPFTTTPAISMSTQVLKTTPTTTPSSTTTTTKGPDTTFTTNTTPTTTTTTTQIPQSTSTTDVMEVSYGCDAKYIQMASQDKGTLFTFDHNCYEIVPTTHTWVDAEKDCVSRGGHLAHITSLMEHNAIYEVVSKYHGHNVWIGLNDRDHEEHFQWSSGDPVNYTNFYGGRKDVFFHGSEDCVTMYLVHSEGKWEDAGCSHRYGYICEFDAVLSSHVVTTPVATISSNPDGDVQWCPPKARALSQQSGTLLVQHGDSCYELLHNKVIWSHGEHFCNQAGGHLATINNAAEQAYVEAFMQRHNNATAVWIGLNDLTTEGQFEWTSGDPITYTNWITGHQDNFVSHNEEDCIAFIPYKGGVWDDIPCGSPGFFGGEYGERHLTFCEYATEKLSAGAVLVG